VASRNGAPTFVIAPRTVPPANGAAVSALACGIAGLLLLVVSGGLAFALAFPLSVIAWMQGRRACRLIDEEHRHHGMARAAVVLGMVGTGLGLLAFVGWSIAFSIDAHVFDQLRHDLQHDRGGHAAHGVRTVASFVSGVLGKPV
jgi:uncharacterized membrane protein YqjE